MKYASQKRKGLTFHEQTLIECKLMEALQEHWSLGASSNMSSEDSDCYSSTNTSSTVASRKRKTTKRLHSQRNTTNTNGLLYAQMVFPEFFIPATAHSQHLRQEISVEHFATTDPRDRLGTFAELRNILASLDIVR